MDHAQLVDVLDARKDLRVHLAGFFFLQPTILNDVLEELAAAAVLHHQVQVVVIFDHLRKVVLKVVKSHSGLHHRVGLRCCV